MSNLRDRSRLLHLNAAQQVDVSSHYAINKKEPGWISRNLNRCIDLLINPKRTRFVSLLLLLSEFFICSFILVKAKYTEIDWSTYIQQVECFLNGTRNYTEISGSTGPIVYPAGHLYSYTLLYWATDNGINIARAQIIFAALYIINLILVFNLYYKTQSVPPIALIFMCFTSYRVHSIYMLRLFNDPISMFLVYFTINLCISRRWTIACIAYSLALSVKMNVLLFAPGLLLLLFENQSIWRAFFNVISIIFVQALIGIPFLNQHPVEYLTRSFELGRVFMFKWTVNYRFLPEHIFIDKHFHYLLLSLHLIVLLSYFGPRIRNVFGSVWRQLFETSKVARVNHHYSDNYIVNTLFASNLIGICFARSLHYQFYLWYFHQLPFLLWSVPLKSTIIRLFVMLVIEWCWNTYPSTVASSGILQSIHVLIVLALFFCRNRSSNKRKM